MFYTILPQYWWTFIIRAHFSTRHESEWSYYSLTLMITFGPLPLYSAGLWQSFVELIWMSPFVTGQHFESLALCNQKKILHTPQRTTHITQPSENFPLLTSSDTKSLSRSYSLSCLYHTFEHVIIGSFVLLSKGLYG